MNKQNLLKYCEKSQYPPKHQWNKQKDHATLLQNTKITRISKGEVLTSISGRRGVPWLVFKDRQIFLSLLTTKNIFGNQPI
jgi:hypothetical protein